MLAAAPRLLPFFRAVLFAASLAASGSAAPPEFAVKAWETDDGLPHNQVAAVLPRRDGFLWVATLGGLARFDGTTFTRLDSPLVRGVKSSNTPSVIEENADALVVSTNQSGLVRVQHGTATLHPLNAQLTPKARPLLLHRETDDVFWVLTSDRALLRWDHGRVERFPPPPRTHGSATGFARDARGTVFIARGAGLEQYDNGRLDALEGAPEGPFALAPARSGGCWLATARQLVIFKEGKFQVVASPPPWSASQVPSALFEDACGVLWIGAIDQGLLRWNDGHTDAVATSHARITSLCEDHEGNLWAATAGGGLDRIQRKRLSLIAEEPDWTDSLVASISEDAAGNMWFANRNGVRKFHPGGPMAGDAGWPKRAVPVVADVGGHMWFSLGGDIYRAKADGSEPPLLVSKTNAETHVIWPAPDGSMWIGHSGRALERILPEGQTSHFGPKSGYNGHNVRAIGGDARGHVWVGTADGRLYEWNRKHFRDCSDALGLAGYPIRTLHGDAEGRMWVGTVGAGVLLVDRGSMHVVGPAQGLPDDVISQILEDDYGWLWFGSQRGIFKVRKTELVNRAMGRTPTINAISFGRADGLSGISAIGNYQPTAWKSRTGELWFVTRKGLVRANPDPRELDPASLRVYLESFVVDGHALADPELQGNDGGEAATVAQPRVASAARRLEFHFTAPTYTAPERVRYRYRLDGVDTNWVEGGTARTATYSSLRPGRYRFNVNASGGDGGWSPAIAELAFEVTPMWWETWWAHLAGIIAFTAALGAIVGLWSHRRLRARLLRLQQEQRVERERKRIARDLHDDLGASLTHVGMMADELSYNWNALTDPRAESMQLAERVRHIARDLDAVVWTTSPQNDSVASLASYLSHFAEEHFRHSPIACRVQRPDDLPTGVLSPEARHHLFMITKELLNNTLKHSQARTVELTMRIVDGVLELVVADDGRGFSLAEAASSGRNGLANLRARAEEIGGVLGMSSTAAGTTATLRFPLRLAARTSRPTIAT